MAAQGYETIRRNPKYQELVRTRSAFGWTLTAITLIIYLGFILLIGYAPKFLGIPMGDSVMTIGLPIGLFVIVSAFVLVGIDHLAGLNEAFGFDVADEVIVEVAQRIRSRLRGGDILGRFSGNKFGVHPR